MPIGQQQQTHTKKKVKGVSFAKADTLRYEHTPVIVFGIAKIKSIKLTAMLSGLKLEGEICGLQSSLQYKVIWTEKPNQWEVHTGCLSTKCQI